MITIKGNTKKGQQMIDRYSNYEGYTLSQVYNKPSTAKQQAWDRCYREYCETDGADAFSITSHNTFGFSVSWNTPQGMRIETPKNSYLVIWPENC